MKNVCNKCGLVFKKQRQIIINGVLYKEVLCKDCVDEICIDIKPRSSHKAKIRYNVPDDIWTRRKEGQGTTKWWISKYGEVEGLKKQKEWKEKTSGSLKRYIAKYGIKEGTKKYNEFKANCSIFNKNRIEKYGKTHYDRTVENYKNRSHTTKVSYYLDITNGNYNEAKQLLAERQRTATLEKYVKKYGQDNGEKKYKILIEKKLLKFEGKSNLEKKYIIDLTNEIKHLNCCYGDNKYMFFTDTKERNRSNKKVYIPDLYIKDLNLIVEIFGDFWHMNPLFYNEKSYNRVLKKTAKEIWDEDNKRISYLKNKYNVDTIVIWEEDIRINWNYIKNNILEKLNNGKN